MTKEIDAALIEAADTSTSAKRLRELSDWADTEERNKIREALAANPNIDNALLWELAADHPSQVADNLQFRLLLLDSEPWWEDCDSQALIQLLALGKDVSDSARIHLAKLIWDELAWSPININLESYQSENIAISCDLPATRDGLVDLLGFTGIFEAYGGSDFEIRNWDDSLPGIAKLVSVVRPGEDCTASYEIRVEFGGVTMRIGIANKDGRYSCSSLDLEHCESSLIQELFYADDLSNFDSAEDRAFVESEILQHLFFRISQPKFTVTLACAIDRIDAQLTEVDRGGAPHDIDPDELIDIIKNLCLGHGDSIDLNTLTCHFDYEIDSIRGGQGYWGIEAVTPTRPCWSLEESLDSFGAGTVSAIGPSGLVYEDEVHEPGQDQQYQNATLCESLATRFCEGKFSQVEFLGILSKALLRSD